LCHDLWTVHATKDALMVGRRVFDWRIKLSKAKVE